MGAAGVVTSAQVASYWSLIESLAPKYVGRFGAEYDDLVQEGAESVYLALRKGKEPSKRLIQKHMSNWVRTMEYQTRYRRLREVSYEELEEVQREQEENNSLPYGWDEATGGLDYIDPSEKELYS